MLSTIPLSLPSLRQHSIFIPPPHISTSGEEEWEVLSRPGEPSIPSRSSKLAISDRDLFVVMGREIRMTSLPAEGFDALEGAVGNYKTLSSTLVCFPILQIVPNPTGRLLAVIGQTQIVVLVLPKGGMSSGEVQCKSFAIDEYQFSSTSSSKISKVIWHPLGEGGNSLWILTSDGQLREYDVRQPEDPTQTFSFLPEYSKPSTSRFTAIDPLENYATSFCFSPAAEEGLYGLMVHVLVASGDIYTMGPVIPFHAGPSIISLRNMRAYTDARLDRAEDDVFGEASQVHARVLMQHQWVESLIKQAKTGEDFKKREETPTKIRSIRASSEIPSSSPPPGKVVVRPPHLSESGGPAPGIHRPILRQGPIVFTPRPRDGDEFDEDIALDLAFILPAPGDDEKKAVNDFQVIVVGWASGTLDVGVLLNRPEPRWVSSRDPEDLEIQATTVEIIRLSSEERLSIQSSVEIVSDPLFPETFYVQHERGVDSVNVAPLVSKLFQSDQGQLAQSSVTRLVESTSSSDVNIIGTVSMCNISLGYCLIALGSSGQLATVELDFQPSSSTDVSMSPAKSVKVIPAAIQSEDPQSLLVRFDIDNLVSSLIRPAQPFNPYPLLRKIPDYNVPLQMISPEHLKGFGTVSEAFQTRLQAIQDASDELEHRVDVQIKEYHRQLKLLKDCHMRISELHSQSRRKRVEELLRAQEVMSDRLTSLISRLAVEYRPQVGEAEKKWFEELDRLKSRVAGNRGLTARVQNVKQQIETLKPRRKEEEDLTGMGYGSRQIKPLEMALSSRSEEIRRLMRKMELLTVKVESGLGDGTV
ncbi:hypothetical protein M231_07317 [Tremella mesenterica]|uniref:Nucleoporin Nup82 n=1 Tax=Tremella mesenterica TaxID=5217 RepID=A0A4Q1BFV1_TREME|nr:hypothetical protein M231_07317 [Tremella mesenterica]